MSDFRVSYIASADDDNFVSQQMQIASVRVRGVDDPRARATIFAEHKQRITRFFQFSDNQHRLANRPHSHYRVTQQGVDMQYINNAGQPLVFVTPTVGPSPAPDESIVLLEEPETMTPPLGLLYVVWAGGRAEGLTEVTVTSKHDNSSVSLDPPEMDFGAVHYVVYFSDGGMPQDVVTAIDNVFEGVDIAPLRLPASAGPRFKGYAAGYIGMDGKDVVYPRFEPVYQCWVEIAAQAQPVVFFTVSSTGQESAQQMLDLTIELHMFRSVSWATALRTSLRTEHDSDSGFTSEFSGVPPSARESHEIGDTTAETSSNPAWPPSGNALMPVYDPDAESVERTTLESETYGWESGDIEEEGGGAFKKNLSNALNPTLELALVNLPPFGDPDLTYPDNPYTREGMWVSYPLFNEVLGEADPPD